LGIEWLLVHGSRFLVGVSLGFGEYGYWFLVGVAPSVAVSCSLRLRFKLSSFVFHARCALCFVHPSVSFHTPYGRVSCLQ
jgi:hypothetical protein